MLAINNITAGYNTYGVSKNQSRSNSNVYSIQKNKITDTFSKGMTEKDIRYSFTFSRTKLNPRISISSKVTETKKEPLLKSEAESTKKLNEPQQGKKRETIGDQMEGIYNFIGAKTDKILGNNNMKKGATYPKFQNTVKDVAKEYKASQNQYNSRNTLNTFA